MWINTRITWGKIGVYSGKKGKTTYFSHILNVDKWKIKKILAECGFPQERGFRHTTNRCGKPRKYDITKILEKLNEEEEEIEKKIEEFEEQITAFFSFIEKSKDGTRFIAKLTSTGQAFSEEDLLKDFIKLLNKFLIVNASIDKTFVTVFTGNEGVLMEDFRKYITDKIIMGEYRAK